MRIIGIDPGYDRCGVAVLEGTRDKPILIDSVCIETNPKDIYLTRLGRVCDEIGGIIGRHRPEQMAIEEVFFSKNQKTALQVATIRGAILHVAHTNHLAVSEYSPQAVKIAVTGYGKADKQQIFAMLPLLLAIPPDKRRDDEYDAIAIGITHLAHIGR